MINILDQHLIRLRLKVVIDIFKYSHSGQRFIQEEQDIRLANVKILVNIITHFSVEFAHSDHLSLSSLWLLIVVAIKLRHIELSCLDLFSELITLLHPAAASHKL